VASTTSSAIVDDDGFDSDVEKVRTSSSLLFAANKPGLITPLQNRRVLKAWSCSSRLAHVRR